MENIEIRPLILADKPALIDFLRRRMPIDGTPLISNLRLPEAETDFIAYHKAGDAFAHTDKICSFLAMDQKTNLIVGCNLCLVCHKSDDHPVDNAGDVRLSEKFHSLIDFNRLMWSGVEEFLPPAYTGPYLKLDLGLVAPEYRRLGLWRRMTDLTLERGHKTFGCKYTIAFCSSYKTQRYCDEEGWSTLRWVNYKDYYVLGKRAFNFESEPEQKYGKLMMLDIQQWFEKRKSV